MAWYGTGGVWTKRAAITLNTTAGTTADHGITIPEEWDSFWSAIDTDGEELRVVDSLGTLLAYTVDDGAGGAFSKSTRAGRIMIDGYVSPGADTVTCVWLYYASTSAQGDASSGAAVPTITSYLELGRPSGPYQITHAPQIPGSTTPLKTFHKTSTESVDLWIYYGALLGRGFTPLNSSNMLDEAYYFTHTVEDSAGAAVGSMVTTSSPRFVWVPRQGLWVRQAVLAGSTGSVYTSASVLHFVNSLYSANVRKQIVETRVGWRVRNNRLSS